MTQSPVFDAARTGSEKYGCLERERRYLLRRMPQGLTAQADHRQITDHYLAGMGLRLRHVYRPTTGESVWKLTQKLRFDPADGTRVMTTTLYLTEAEHRLLLVPPLWQIRKDRYPFDHGGRHFGVDVFWGTLSGLILAETECRSDEELAGLLLPDFAARDVSQCEEFTGGALALLTPTADWWERIREA